MEKSSREEERDLISQAQGGSRAAFDHLMNLYQNRIFRTAKRLTGNPEDARDVLQKAFMKAFVHLPEFRGESQFYTWLTTITLNEARMTMRRRRAREIPLEEPRGSSDYNASWEPSDPRLTPEEQCLSSQLCQILSRHLTAMPQGIQKIIHLRYYQELTITEIALLIGISNTAAKSQLYRGMLLLRKSFQRQLGAATAPRNSRRLSPEN
ncbi:MAG TPA: sigma-70 family RNA polymerase sigma factor [Acidobacteriaceae bacterium]|jgi:RNA polymerase sigma-70 factor (ECF subfamily)|nr:sigma-70 family RNA polymerase sigma factor [Acidobacteriaceae bacterium]